MCDLEIVERKEREESECFRVDYETLCVDKFKYRRVIPALAFEKKENIKTQNLDFIHVLAKSRILAHHPLLAHAIGWIEERFFDLTSNYISGMPSSYDF